MQLDWLICRKIYNRKSEWMIEYFGTDSKFQEHNRKNTDNRKKQKTKHRIRSKSYSQLSFDKDPKN